MVTSQVTGRSPSRRGARLGALGRARHPQRASAGSPGRAHYPYRLTGPTGRRLYSKMAMALQPSPAPEKAAAAAQDVAPAARCPATTKEGQPCSIDARPSERCHVHDPEVQCGGTTRKGKIYVVPTGGGRCKYHLDQPQDAPGDGQLTIRPWEPAEHGEAIACGYVWRCGDRPGRPGSPRRPPLDQAVIGDHEHRRPRRHSTSLLVPGPHASL